MTGCRIEIAGVASWLNADVPRCIANRVENAFRLGVADLVHMTDEGTVARADHTESIKRGFGGEHVD